MAGPRRAERLRAGGAELYEEAHSRHTETSISGDTRVDWSDALDCVIFDAD
jgi:hypothetical protein